MSQAGSGQVLALGDCQFDPARGLLLCAGQPVQLRPRTFALLEHLAAHHGRVVSKSELMDAVWPNVIVTEDSLTQAVRDLRRALGPAGEEVVRTIARRGYLLAPAAARSVPERRQPSLAVLRFSHTGHQVDDPLVDGFAEDIIAGLARFRRAMILAHNSSFTFASDAKLDWREAGRRLGADYLVRGHLQRDGQTIKATIGIIETSNGALLCTEDFHASGAAIFEVQAEITRKILNRLVSRLDDATLTQARSRPPASLGSYELLLRGLARLRGYRNEDNETARDLFIAALENDPDYALAHAYLALAELIIGGCATAAHDVLMSGIERAQFSVTLAPEEPRCHRVLALTRLFAREHEPAQRSLQRALDLNPSDADTITQMGYLMALRGKPFEALALFDQAARMNPIHPLWYNYDRVVALYSAAEYAAAIDCFADLPVRTAWRLLRLAACHAQLGNREEARQLVAEMRRLAPGFQPLAFATNGLAFEYQSDVDHFVAGVEKALAA